MTGAAVVGKTILELDLLTGQIDSANSYIEVHVVGQASSVKVPLGGVTVNGKSAYEVAVAAGFSGTEAQWLSSLQGATGKSAYQSALDSGFVGTEMDFVASLKGPKGDQGLQGNQGVKGDTGTTGNSAYQDAVAQGFVGDLPTWLASLKGPKGDQGIQGTAGTNGASIIQTSGAPAAAVGNDNDLAYDPATSTIYGPKAAGAWPAGVVLKGPKGDTGNAGANGNTLLSTNGNPAAGTGNDGDFAYDPATSTMYGPKAAGAWPAGVVIKGAKGDQGVQGLQGNTGPTGQSAFEAAAAGGFVGTQAEWLTSLHGNSAYQDAVAQGFVGDLPTWLASLKGPKGDQGIQGVAGASAVLGHLVGTVADSTALPDPTGYVQSDYFFVGTHVWMNFNGAWTDMGDFQGLPGKDGSGITVLGQLPGTAYLPTSGQRNGDSWLIGKSMWVWNGSAWQEQGNQGLQGDPGPAGATGPAGPSAWDVIRSTHPDIDTIDKFAAYITGPQGLKGDTAISFVADGTVATSADLPATGTNNHGYLVGDPTNGYDFYVWVNTQFVNLGRNVGPKGDTGAPGATGQQGPAGRSMTAKGVLANTGALPATGNLVGDTYSISGHFWSWDGAQFVDNGDFTGPQGLQGVEGPVGQPVNAKGSVAAVANLPATGNANGDAYEVGGYIYVWNNTLAQWVNMGQWRGANGTNGTNGLSAYQQAQAAGFAGTEAEWLTSLKGKDGVSFTYIGSFANAAGLPTGTNTSAAATTTDTNHLYLWDATNGWVDNGPIGVQGPQGLQGPVGADGKTAYEVAVANGFVGDVTAWLTSLKGLQGDSAYTVAVNQGFVGTQAQWLASLVGPKGDQGIQGIQGIQGVQGNTGPQGTSLAYIGDFASAAAIPAGTLSQVATAGGHIFFNNGTTWVDSGPVAQGPQGIQGIQGVKGDTGATGQSAYDLAVAGGFVGTQAAWLQTLVGPAGASAVDAAIAAGKLQPGATINDYITLTTGPQGPAGADGATGPQGQTGPAISIIGQLSDSSQLPATGTAGTGYAIPDSSTPGTYNCWIWLSTTSQWFNLGHVVGAQGPQGIQGLRGIQGLTGPQGATGAQGTLWIVFARNPQSLDGRVGDYFYNSNTQEFFTKTDTATWASLGHIGGGNLNAPAQNGKFNAYNDSGWAALPDVVNNLPVDATGKKVYALMGGEWIEQTLLDSIPTDTGTYILKSGVWTRLDTYTLKAVDAAINAGAVTLDLNVARTFRIQNTAAAAITMTNLPAADRTTTVIVKIYGKANAMSWTNTIRWFDGSAPPLTNSTTTVVLNWDGTEWVGSVPN